MSSSLSKIKSQILKLQKQAATIESGIISRIKGEIAKHGLTAEQLFGGSSTVGATSASAKPKAAARSGAIKPAKFADSNGNTWGGMGKRPQWIRDAIEAGKSLEEFLVASKKSAVVKAKPAVKAVTAKKAKAAKAAAPEKRAPAKRAAPAKAAKAPAAKRSVKVSAKKAAVRRPAKRAAAASADQAPSPEA
jgi:DNA-binding protein H-NS